MDKRWYKRLQAWKQEAEEKLRRKWYLWPIGFGVDLLWHRVYGATNDLLDTHGADWLRMITKHVPSDIVSLAVLTSLVIIVGLTIHAYFDSRPPVVQIDQQPKPKLLLSCPVNAEALITSWRVMVTDVQREATETRMHTADVLVKHPTFPSIRPYLGEQAKKILDTPRHLLEIVTLNHKPMDMLLGYVLDDIDRVAKEWQIDRPVLKERLGTRDGTTMAHREIRGIEAVPRWI